MKIIWLNRLKTSFLKLKLLHLSRVNLVILQSFYIKKRRQRNRFFLIFPHHHSIHLPISCTPTLLDVRGSSRRRLFKFHMTRQMITKLDSNESEKQLIVWREFSMVDGYYHIPMDVAASIFIKINFQLPLKRYIQMTRRHDIFFLVLKNYPNSYIFLD